MINQQLIDYIKQQILKGLNRETIIKDLLGNGWEIKDIEEGFTSIDVSNLALQNNPTSNIAYINKSDNFLKIRNILNKKTLMLIIIIFVIVMGVLVYFFRNDLFLIKSKYVPLDEINQEGNNIKNNINSFNPSVIENYSVENQDLSQFIKYKYISINERLALKQKFLELNKEATNVEFNPYGFIKLVRILNNSKNYTETFSEKEILFLKNFIIKNKESFGVTDISNFDLSQKTHYGTMIDKYGEHENSVLGYYLTAEQNINGYHFDMSFYLEYDTPIRILKDSGSGNYNIYGNFWPNASLPEKPKLELEAIENMFVGKEYVIPEERKFDLDCGMTRGGGDCSSYVVKEKQIFIIKKSDLKIDLTPHFVRPKGLNTSEQDIYLQLAFRVELLLPEGWVKYIDSRTGEEFPNI
jgi:hypothetical protein